MLKTTLAICALTICGSMNLQAREPASLSPHVIEADYQQEALLAKKKKKQESSSSSVDEAVLAKKKKKQESSSSSVDEALARCCKGGKCRSKRHA